jgi:DNA polymerase (family 10)
VPVRTPTSTSSAICDRTAHRQTAPVDADLDTVFEACTRTGTALEIGSSPDRLDLSAEHIRQARRHGVRFSIDSDAHAIRHLPYLRYGVGTAQRGRLTPGDVINTWPLDQLMEFLRKRPDGAKPYPIKNGGPVGPGQPPARLRQAQGEIPPEIPHG